MLQSQISCAMFSFPIIASPASLVGYIFDNREQCRRGSRELLRSLDVVTSRPHHMTPFLEEHWSVIKFIDQCLVRGME